MRYELTDHEWRAIRPMLPDKPRGVPRVDDRCNRPSQCQRRTSIETQF
jgi:transposase